MASANKRVSEWDLNDFMQFIKSIGIKRQEYNKIKQGYQENVLSVSDIRDGDFNDLAECFGISKICAKKIERELKKRIATEMNRYIPDENKEENEQFHVNIYMGRNIRLRRLFTANSYVSDVAQAYKDEEGLPTDNFELTSKGKMLQRNKTLGQCGITNEMNVICVTFWAQGGGPDPEEKKESIVDEITEAIKQIKVNPQSSRANVFKLAKQAYRQKGKPVIIDKDDALKDARQNAANYKNVALPITLAIDKDFSTWNEKQFKRDFARKFDVPIECIEIVSVRAGSILADVKLHTHWKDKDKKTQKSMSIEVLADKIDPKKAEKAFAEFAIFAVEFGLPTAGFDCTRQRVIMNPKWNRGYGPGATDWDGALNDGKSRGGEAYYCPKGWKRFAIQFEEEALDFAGTYDKWPIAYHGTKFDFSMMITLSGLRCSKGYPPFGAHGPGVYLSPSIKYVSHPRYCQPIKLNLNKQEWKKHNIKQDQINDFKSYDGKWVQCAFMVRVKPGSYRKCGETMGLGKSGKFDNVDKKEIEWIIDGKEGTIIGNEKILIYGIMIRARNAEQTGYDDY